MDDNDLDRLLRGLKDKPALEQTGAFEAGVWDRIRRNANGLQRLTASWSILAPAIAWRAAPAALALVIGGISGAAISAPHVHDELDVFRANSSYLIASKLDPREDRH
ncbi:hypothetical protein [uncultured Maricaulis sp.]|uniref:hypothetical protein n=1 Tax=uncultured Maricaulis sp. TaxID=174710 RepID=UPI0030D7A0EB|tara:strand:+ start:23182 stop:23502 length:321 start_codon:yes stop_codon:yes gene_type:complete